MNIPSLSHSPEEEYVCRLFSQV